MNTLQSPADGNQHGRPRVEGKPSSANESTDAQIVLPLAAGLVFLVVLVTSAFLG